MSAMVPLLGASGHSVECLTFRTLLVTLYRHDAYTPAQDRTQLGVAELLKGAVVIDRRVDHLELESGIGAVAVPRRTSVSRWRI